MTGKKILGALCLALLIVPLQAQACDLCALYNSIEDQKPLEGHFKFSVAEQFTEYNKIQTDGSKIENQMHQNLRSSITQFLGSYGLSSEASLQMSLPYISRHFTRLENEAIEKGVESGIGDLTIVGRYLGYQYQNDDQYFGVQLIGGIKLPTGSSSRLNEESEEKESVDHVDDASVHEDEMSSDTHLHGLVRHGDEDHAGHSSAIHGHDLALGSGSVDFPLGVSALYESGRAFVKGSIIHTIRTQGDHSYQYADHTSWDIGPGYYLHLEQESRVAARVVLSGERKSKDSGKDGEIHTDTAISTIFWGPEISYAINDRLSGDIGVDLPVDIDNTGTQAVAAYKLRAGLTYNF